MGVLVTTDFITEGRLVYGLASTAVYTDAMLLQKLNDAYLVDIAAQTAIPELTDESQITVGRGVTFYPLDMTKYVRINDVVRVQDSYVVRPADAQNIAQLGGNLPHSAARDDRVLVSDERDGGGQPQSVQSPGGRYRS